jgi:hypothetical protein
MRSGWNFSKSPSFSPGRRVEDRLAGDLLDRQRRAAAGVAVELGHHDAVEVDGLGELLATLTASWPVIASTTSRIACGLTACGCS